jgi:hypothetical protein
MSPNNYQDSRAPDYSPIIESITSTRTFSLIAAGVIKWLKSLVTLLKGLGVGVAYEDAKSLPIDKRNLFIRNDPLFCFS